MKKTINLIACVGLFAFSANAQNTYTINGKFTALKEDKKVFLAYRSLGKTIEDSTVTKNGLFSFKGQIGNDAVKAYLTFEPVKIDSSVTFIEKRLKTDQKDFFLEKGITKVGGSSTMKKAVITGGKAQAENLELEAEMKPELDQIEPLQEEMVAIYIRTQAKGVDTIQRMKEIRKLMTPYALKAQEKQNTFFKSHPDSYVSLDMVQGKSTVIKLETFEPMFNSLRERLRTTAEGKLLVKKLEIARKTSVGVVAMDFTQPDVNGKPISLSSYKGKYVLIDFWASWCGPCRKENPNVLKAYNEFKDKNFDVLAVSLDDKKDNWLKAVKEDGLPWTQVSDLLGFKNAAAQAYAISAIPQNFLLDPNGKIIASNLRGDALMKKLQQVIN
ncbi:TlpA disulfide reductase family protein [Pedobacter sp.]|jgi:peroxiredoxin|uniref:TlpA disulfide reductase family protein n=1 Tax=Pedobacter sp. TaxID=1411316 RepID=UPI002CA9DD82|nr:TlpA disulfide reductase family protein [Pedobacter sp.]HWW40843.1 TlpA disulfide reductase family protein [Pedobacter sp.]